MLYEFGQLSIVTLDCKSIFICLTQISLCNDLQLQPPRRTLIEIGIGILLCVLFDTLIGAVLGHHHELSTVGTSTHTHASLGVGPYLPCLGTTPTVKTM